MNRTRVLSLSLIAAAVLAGFIAACTPTPPTDASACDVILLDSGHTLIECPEGATVSVEVESSAGFGVRVNSMNPTGGLEDADGWTVLGATGPCDAEQGVNETGRFVWFDCAGTASVTLDLGEGSIIGVGPVPGGTARVTAVL